MLPSVAGGATGDNIKLRVDCLDNILQGIFILVDGLQNITEYRSSIIVNNGEFDKGRAHINSQEEIISPADNYFIHVACKSGVFCNDIFVCNCFHHVGEGKVEVSPDTAYVDAGITVDNRRAVKEVQDTINTINNKIYVIGYKW